ncbi:MAG: A/G-specific adenine glycosylase [Verrucomicrobiota bacterium]
MLTSQAKTFRSSLLDWYDSHARELPWRSSPSLYKTVVSELMLQQTQVKTVLPYFDRWLKRFPDFQALANASEEDVLKHWEGLGYYSRARNLHKLAKEVAALDSIPTDAKSWQAFPGIGPYASAAVTSITFNTPAAVVDGNVVRILSRLTADASDYKNSSDAAKAYQALANDLLNPKRPGDHNQAMMELGATVCHKQKPLCMLCPVTSLCEARAKGIEETLPRLAKAKYEEKTVDRAWIQNGDKFLLRKIPETASRMKGLHEIPSLEQCGLKLPKSAKPALTRKRSITKYRITERIHALSPSKLPPELSEDLLWATQSDLDNLPLSGPHRRWLEELLKT